MTRAKNMRVKSKCKNENNKKVLSLHSLHSLQSAWSAFWGDPIHLEFQITVPPMPAESQSKKPQDATYGMALIFSGINQFDRDKFCLDF